LHDFPRHESCSFHNLRDFADGCDRKNSETLDPTRNPKLARMLSSPTPHEAPEAATLRGQIFTDLDRLAFALEMEAARLLDEGREEEARRSQEQRLGVRLAQRLVTGVWADEVNLRLQEWGAEYDARLAPEVAR
jgi:hypothetical protein